MDGTQLRQLSPATAATTRCQRVLPPPPRRQHWSLTPVSYDSAQHPGSVLYTHTLGAGDLINAHKQILMGPSDADEHTLAGICVCARHFRIKIKTVQSDIIAGASDNVSSS